MDQQQPRILIWDLETAGVNALQADLSAIVCFGYKFLGDKKARVLTVDMFPGWFSRENGINDKPLLKAMLKVMEEADLTVAHYGERFDKVFFQGRCAIQGLTPPPPTKMRDTWYIAYKTFRFSSNRLVNLADIFRLGQKKTRKEVPDEWPGWWLKALAGNRKAIAEMAEYCKQDVETLEQVYLRLRPFDQQHPRLVQDRAHCGSCGSKSIQYRGFAFTGQRKYRRFVCRECGRWDRNRRPEPLR